MIIFLHTTVGSTPTPSCSAGLYALEGSERCDLTCPRGSYCPEGVRQPLLCPAGRWGGVRGLHTSECSGPAAPGYYTPIGSLTANERSCASATDANAVFCPAGSAAPRIVSRNHFTTGGDETAGRTRSGELECPPGTFCSAGVRLPCAAGRYGVECALVCPRGSYCLAGSALPTPCAAGRWGANESMVSAVCSGLTPPGRYTAAAGATTPIDCPAGRFGFEGGATTALCGGACEAGYWCAARSSSATARACGGRGVFCAVGSSSPQPVRRGWYSTGANGTSGGTNAVAALHQIDEARCTPGWACEHGERRACAAGRFAESPEQHNFNCTGPCDAGFFCAVGSSSRRQHACGDASKYCPLGSPAPLLAPTGRYTIDGDEGTRSASALCPTGSWCERGVKRRCSAGRYGATLGLGSANCSAPAPRGRYATIGSELPLDCPAGRYGACKCCGFILPSSSDSHHFIIPPLFSLPFSFFSHFRRPRGAEGRGVQRSVPRGALLRCRIDLLHAVGVRLGRSVLPTWERCAAKRGERALLHRRRREHARRAARVQERQRDARCLPLIDAALKIVI